MTREPIRPIPKGILAARSALNELAQESKIKLLAKNSLWTEAELVCSPLTCKVSYSRENIELVLDIQVGRIFDTLAIDEIMEDLPIPVNYSYPLEPQPILTVTDQLAVVPDISKSEVYFFINNALMKALMTLQICLVTDSLTKESKDLIAKSSIPPAKSLWDFGGLSESLLSAHG